MQLVYLGNATYSGRNAQQQNKEEKAASNKYVINPVVIVGNWISISWGNSEKHIDHVTQHYPTQETRELRPLYTPAPRVIA